MLSVQDTQHNPDILEQGRAFARAHLRECAREVLEHTPERPTHNSRLNELMKMLTPAAPAYNLEMYAQILVEQAALEKVAAEP